MHVWRKVSVYTIFASRTPGTGLARCRSGVDDAPLTPPRVPMRAVLHRGVPRVAPRPLVEAAVHILSCCAALARRPSLGL